MTGGLYFMLSYTFAHAIDDGQDALVAGGRPVNAVVTGDANQDGNNANDRLPGVRRNSFTGPDYATTDVRITRRIYAGDRLKMELVGESFNLLNRDNRRVLITEDGFQTIRRHSYRQLNILESTTFRRKPRSKQLSSRY
jgi:hypothetical protein